jgi:hypothetical protein
VYAKAVVEVMAVIFSSRVACALTMRGRAVRQPSPSRECE